MKTLVIILLLIVGATVCSAQGVEKNNWKIAGIQVDENAQGPGSYSPDNNSEEKMKDWRMKKYQLCASKEVCMVCFAILSIILMVLSNVFVFFTKKVNTGLVFAGISSIFAALAALVAFIIGLMFVSAALIAFDFASALIIFITFVLAFIVFVSSTYHALMISVLTIEENIHRDFSNWYPDYKQTLIWYYAPIIPGLIMLLI